MTNSAPQTIVKQVTLRASRTRVWRALTNAKEFGAWFGAHFEGEFAPGAAMRGEIQPTTADPDVAKLQEAHAGTPMNISIERIEPERLFSFRWHPYAIDPNVDYASQPTTLVEFELEEVAEGVLLTITESGFEHVPIDRRAAAFEANDGGWAHQSRLIQKYLADAA